MHWQLRLWPVDYPGSWGRNEMREDQGGGGGGLSVDSVLYIILCVCVDIYMSIELIIVVDSIFIVHCIVLCITPVLVLLQDYFPYLSLTPQVPPHINLCVEIPHPNWATSARRLTPRLWQEMQMLSAHEQSTINHYHYSIDCNCNCCYCLVLLSLLLSLSLSYYIITTSTSSVQLWSSPSQPTTPSLPHPPPVAGN